MTIKCVIFDCDGTLVDSEKIWNQALAKILAKMGVTASIEVLMQQNQGIRFTQVLENVSQKYDIKISDDLLKNYHRIVSELFVQKLKPINDVETALQAIKLPMCVASNGPMDKVKLSLEITELDKYFNGYLFSGYDIDSWKPDPELFLHAAQVMGYAPEECIVVEDSLVGVEAAIAAGMKPLLFNHSNIVDYPSQASSFSDMRLLPHLLKSA